MSLGRSVPWTCWEEWNQVGDWLQSKEASTVQKGLDRVATWRSRGRVPLGVDSTACFVETRLRDESGDLAQLPLRMQYSLAVVRMVNGIADSSQKGRMAASVASLSAAAGLPSILVDLRHEATHNELPSLAALQLAAQHALTWLRTNYWQRQKDHVELNKTKVSTVVCDYIASHMAAAIKAAAAIQQQDYDSESDEDQDDHGGNNNTATAAEATAARVSGGEYNVAEARKQRQALLTELRVAVPTPAAHLLIDGLLQAQIMASKDSSSTVVIRALTHAMKHLEEGWSQLPAVLLDTAAAALSPSFLKNYPCSGAPPPPASLADWEIWLHVLAPEGKVNISENTARSLLATCLLSLSEIEQAPHTWWLQKNAAVDSKHPNTDIAAKIELNAQRCSILQRLLEVILPCIKDKTLQQRCLTVASSVTKNIQDDASPQMMEATATAKRGGAAIPVPIPVSLDGKLSTISVSSDLQKLIYEVGISQGGPKRAMIIDEKSKEKKLKISNSARDGVDDGNSGDTHKDKKIRWTRCQNWSPCAIGMLPSAIDPNGKLPRLELKEDFQLRKLPKEDMVLPSDIAMEGGDGEGGGRSGEYHTFVIGGGANAAAARVGAVSGEEDEEEQLDGFSDDIVDEDEDVLDEEGEIDVPAAAAGTTGRCPPPLAVRPRI